MSIQRISPGPRMSKAVIHGDRVLTAGIVAGDPSADVQGQTRQILQSIEALLKEAGSDKSKILTATIWLADISNFEQMNQVWDEWVDRANPPARATVEARLAKPEFAIEIQVQAAR